MYLGSNYVHFDVEDEKKLKKFRLDDEVTVTIKGKVCEIRGAEKPPEASDNCCSCAPSPAGWPGGLKVELASVSVDGVNVFSELSKDDDEDEKRGGDEY